MAKFIFPFIAQPHQTLHALPIALELASRDLDAEIVVACTTPEHLTYARHLASFYPEAEGRISYQLLKMPALVRQITARYGPFALGKLATLYANRRYFASFDAIIVPERTSLYLKRWGVHQPRLIWTRHGAGDRAIGFAKDVRLFDFILLPGRKIEERLKSQQALRKGHFYTGVYPKFDIVRRMLPAQPKLFDDDLPIVLYNPHSSRSLSSWWKFGLELLEWFAKQDQYNLIFAPHYKMFSKRHASTRRLKEKFAQCANILIDTGSTKSLDMTYTMAANIYIGDVSSQVAEFLIRPRPCIFLNAHRIAWENDPNYRFWALGDVTTTLDNFKATLENAVSAHADYLEKQREYLDDTFGDCSKGPTAPLAAKAIIEYLAREA